MGEEKGKEMTGCAVNVSFKFPLKFSSSNEHLSQMCE